MSDFFSNETVELLKENLSSEDIKTRDGTGNQKLSYIASHHAINEANRIFGFGNWSTEIQHLHQVDKTIYEKPPYNAGDDPKEMIAVSYLCQLKLTVTNGERTVSHEDTGFGNGVAGHTAHGIGSSIELATKEAVTDSLKRCLRYYGNKFGLSLYDKDDNGAMAPIEIEKAKIVTEEQLKELRELYEARGVDDEWVLLALKGEDLIIDDLKLMRNDWYQLAYKITKNYKLDEIESANYEVDIARVFRLMRESATMGMLKSLFQEAWTKTQHNKDKERQAESQKIYEEMKTKLEKVA